MKNNNTPNASSLYLNWLKDNVIQEIPVIGNTLTQQNLESLEQDIKHFFSMLIGLFVMMIGSMPDPMSMDKPKTDTFTMQFISMLFYMYVGMFAANLFFNIGKTGVNFCKDAFFASSDTNVIEEQISFICSAPGSTLGFCDFWQTHRKSILRGMGAMTVAGLIALPSLLKAEN